MLRELLLEKQFRIEFYTCCEKNWKLTKEASPGNLKQVEDLLFENCDISSCPTVLTLNLQPQGDQTIIGVAFTDSSSSNKISVAEFIDNPYYSNLEVFFIKQSLF
jgi:DNA mismatch repair protein MSH2